MRNRLAILLATLAVLAAGLVGVTAQPSVADDPRDEPTSEPTDDPRETDPPEVPDTGEALAFPSTAKECMEFRATPLTNSPTKVCAQAKWITTAYGMRTNSVRFTVEGNKAPLDANPAVTIYDQHVRGCTSYDPSTQACTYDAYGGSAWNNNGTYALPKYNTAWNSPPINATHQAYVGIYWAHVNVHVNNYLDYEMYVGVFYGYAGYGFPTLYCNDGGGPFSCGGP